jgi:hypothetical protein
VREFLERRRVHVDDLEFRVMAPVSVRSADERGSLGNRVSAWVVDLPIAERDPRQADRAHQRVDGEAQGIEASVGAELLTQAAAWTPSTLLSLGSRMVLRALPFNLVVTNVPGPQMPLYLLGARMIENFGMVPLTDYLGLGSRSSATPARSAGASMPTGILVPDVHEFASATEDAFRELWRRRGGHAGPGGAGAANAPAPTGRSAARSALTGRARCATTRRSPPAAASVAARPRAIAGSGT